jgi:polyisoprenoid-binding protein YceI
MAPSGQLTGPAVQALLADATLAGDWTLDRARSTIGLQSRSVWGLAPVKGAFGHVSGHGTVSPAGEVNGTITVAAGSIETKNAKRDRHLRSGDFFATDTFPHITFSVDRLLPSSEGVTVAGQLTVRGRTKPVTFPATVSVAGPGEVWLDAEVHINRADFGLTWNQLGMASMNSTLTIHAVFARVSACE